MDDLYPIKILLVDDDESSLTFLFSLLRKKFIKVLKAPNGKEGFELYIKERPDVIISDIAMPIVNGLEMAEQIKQIDKNAVIILQTAFDNKELLFRAIEIGITQYLLKPVDRGKVLEILNSLAKSILLTKHMQAKDEYIKALSSAVENASAMIMILSPGGKITYANKLFYEVSGYSPNDLKDTVFIEYFSIGNHEDHVELKDAIANSIEYRGEAILITQNVPEIWVSISLSPIFDEHGKTANFSVVIGDITKRIVEKQELKKINEVLEKNVKERTSQYMELNAVLLEEIEIRKATEKELISAKEFAEKANFSKSAFMAKVSHELRTPMNGIMGMTSLLMETIEDSKSKKSLEIVFNSAKSLLRLINDILDYAKLESGKLSLFEADFSFHAMLDELKELFYPIAADVGLRLNTVVDASIPKFMFGDSIRLRQILINLTGNAIKFTNQGEITISAKIQSQSETELELLCSVKDTGVGIPEDKHGLLFKSFSQIEHHLTRRHGGVGLGLYISKEIVEIMRGKIWFESKEDEGSTFYFTAWLKKSTNFGNSQKEIEEKINTNLSSLLGYSPNILIADDSVINQEVFKEMLSQMNVIPIIANNGFEAIEILEESDCDALLIDAEMPGINGFEVVHYIKNLGDKKLSGMPVILITAYDIDDNAPEIKEAGINKVLQKPCSKNDLYKAFSVLLKPRDAEHDENRLNMHKLIESINGSKDVLSKLIEYFNNTIDGSLLKLSGYVAENNMKNIFAEAHKLKSELSTIGASKAVEFLRAIENKVKLNDITLLSDIMISLINEIDYVKEYFLQNSVDTILESYKELKT